MENKAKELTFLDVLNIIFSRKILLAAITLMITILGTIILGVFYNNASASYTTSFVLDYPGIETLTLPDGSSLKYSNFISQTSLEKVKDSSNLYSSIDVEALALSDDISISQEIITNSANKKDTVYTITVKAKYFDNKEIAKSFLKDLSTFPITNIKEVVKSTVHDDFLAAYNDSISFDNKLNFLISQKNYLLTSYDTTIGQVGNISLNNKTLTAYKNNIKNYFSVNSLDLLVNEFEREGYAPKNDALANQYDLEIKNLENNLASNEAILKAIRDAIDDSAYAGKEFDSTKIIELSEENAKITKKLEVLKIKLAYAKGEIVDTSLCEDFTNRLDQFYNKIDEFTNEYLQNIDSIYEQLSSISFKNSSIIKEVGSISFAIAGAASFIIGFVVASVVILILKFSKKK